MSFSVTGRFFFVDRNDTVRLAKTHDFLRGLGFFRHMLADELNDKTVEIEIRDLPNVLRDLFNSGLFKIDSYERYTLDVIELSERGVLFYFTYPSGAAKRSSLFRT